MKKHIAFQVNPDAMDWYKKKYSHIASKCHITNKLQYITNCVCADGDDINEMKDKAIDITWDTFIKHVAWQSIQKVFSYYSYRGEHLNPQTGEQTCGFHIKDDYAVSFHRSKYKGKLCYYIRHSGIEYIWG